MMPKLMNINARTADARLHLWRDMMPVKLAVSCQLAICLFNRHLANGSLFYILDSNSPIRANWHLAVRCKFDLWGSQSIAAEYATGKRQPDANLQFLVNKPLTTGSYIPARLERDLEHNSWIGYWQTKVRCQIANSNELATSSQIPIRFERVSDDWS